MSPAISLIEDAVRRTLKEIGLTPSRLEVTVLDPGTNTYSITIVDDSFAGTAYIDREMRVRPPLAHAFASVGLARSSYVIDVQTSEEDSLGSGDLATKYDDELVDSEDTEASERINRAAWRLQVDSVRRALVGSHFLIEPLLGEGLILATRNQLSVEKILIGFAKSTNATTVDTDIRRAMQSARDTLKVTECYYLSHVILKAPFANQTAAYWINLHTAISFLHKLNASATLATAQRHLLRDIIDRVPETLRGPVIEPDFRNEDGIAGDTGFFGTINNWLQGEESSLLVVMANAGHGKTTLTQELADRISANFINDENQPIPLWLPFEATRRVVDVESLVNSRLSQLRPGTLAPFLELLRSNHALLLVDGFDELADDAGMEVAENQIRSLRPFLEGRAKVLLAGRTLFAKTFAGAAALSERMRSLVGGVQVKVLELQPFDGDQQAQFIRSRQGQGPEQKESVISFASASPDNEELCSNPLFLRIVYGLSMSGHLPPLIGGMLPLVQAVCEREEQRQHLGIGVDGQLRFLEWIATDLHDAGVSHILQSNVGDIAHLIAEESLPTLQLDRAGEIAGRLASHALLSLSRDSRVCFINPLIKDVLLGRACEEAVAKGNWRLLGTSELPEGSVQYVALSESKAFESFPALWLSRRRPEINMQVLRNLFRVAVASAHARKTGNPRMWLFHNWTDQKVIRGLPLRGMLVESLSFDGLHLRECDLTGTIFDDCDFRSTVLEQCVLLQTTFLGCRADSSMLITSDVQDALVVSEGRSIRADSAMALREALIKSTAGESLESGPSDDVVKASEKLVAAALSQFAMLDEVGPRFLTLYRDSLPRLSLGVAAEERVLEKIIYPAIISKMCVSRLIGSSKEAFDLDKRWRRAVVDYLGTGGKTPALSAFISGVATKAGRYLE